MLRLNERAAFAVGVKLRKEGMTIAVTGLGGQLVSHVSHPLQSMDPDSVLDQVAGRVVEAIQQAQVMPSTVLGLGIGMPGVIDYVQGRCRFSPLLGWRDVAVRAGLESRLDLSVYVDNDVNMLTAAEAAFGHGREVSDFLTVTIGSGIGLGIVIRGEIYRGTFGGAGELGHTKVESTLMCECGAMGCLEAVASDTGIQTQVATIVRRSTVTLQECVALAEQGDQRVQEVFQRSGTLLGRSIGNLLNLINPELVVISGEGLSAGPVRVNPLLKAIRSAAFSLLGTDTRVVVQQWGDEAWARGAASIVVHEMIKAPIYESATSRPLMRLLGRDGLGASEGRHA